MFLRNTGLCSKTKKAVETAFRQKTKCEFLWFPLNNQKSINKNMEINIAILLAQ